MYANHPQQPTLASYLVLDWVQLYQIGLIVAQAQIAREAGISALADLTTQAYRVAWGL